MIADRNIVQDGQTTVTGGVNSGDAPSLVLPDQVSFAVNMTMRGDFPRTRPGWVQRELTFPDTTVQANFEEGLFQQATFYDSQDDQDSLVALIAGRVFRIRVSDLSVLEITPLTPSGSADIGMPTLQEAWMQQAEQFLVIQNDLDAPIVWDGSTSSRSQTVPSGSVMTYALGRLWVTLRGRRSFVGSDLVYGPTGTEQYQFADAVLQFDENTYLSEGGAFGVPAQFGDITAMVPIANLDTSLGQGPIQVFGQRGSFSVNAPFDRTTWKDLTWPIQTVSTLSPGPAGSESVVQLNGDLWFRAIDGLRSFQVARRNHGSWVQSPQSHEMDRVLSVDDLALLKFSSAVVFDNRLLVTTAPRYVAGVGCQHLGVVALNLDNIAAITEQSAPSYDGVWTGLKILKIVAGITGGVERCFAFVYNENDEKIELWELSKSDAYDQPIVDGNKEDRRISWILETRSFNYRSPFDLKSLESSDIWLDHLHGSVDITSKYRSDQYPAWTTISTVTACAQMTNCTSSDCNTMYDLLEQHRSRLMFPRPADGCDSTNSRQLRNGYEHQFRLEGVGACSIIKFRTRARLLPEIPGGCSP